MLLLISCTTLPKQEEEEIPETDRTYFPAFPSPYKDGEPVVTFQEKLELNKITYFNMILIPYWYWLLIIQYVNDTEAAIQSLVPK